MGESLTQRRRVREEALRGVNRCRGGRMVLGGNAQDLTVPSKEAPANSVPAAAVIQRVRALFGITGRKARAGGPLSPSVKCRGSTPLHAADTGGLETRRGKRNSGCSGGMRRDPEEHQWRRRSAGQWDRKVPLTDTEARQRGEQTGLDTLVVHAVNDGH